MRCKLLDYSFRFSNFLCARIENEPYTIDIFLTNNGVRRFTLSKGNFCIVRKFSSSVMPEICSLRIMSVNQNQRADFWLVKVNRTGKFATNAVSKRNTTIFSIKFALFQLIVVT